MAGWCFILLLPSEFICMQMFGFLDHLRLTHCNMLIGCFPRRSSWRGLGSVESKSCSCQRQDEHLCYTHACGCCMPRTSLQCAQLLPGLTSPTHRPELNPSLLPRRGAGSITCHARSGVWTPRSPQAHTSILFLPLFPPLLRLIMEFI